MKIACPSCGEHVQAADVNLDRMMAKCRGCDAVFSFDGAGPAPGGAPPPSAPAQPREKPLPVPIGVEVQEAGAPGAGASGDYRHAGGAGRLVLTRRWLSTNHKISLALGLLWMVLMSVWLVVGIVKGDVLFVVLPLLNLTLGLALVYFAALGFSNATRIEVAGGQLSVTHGPLPAFWVPSPRIPVGPIQQLHVREKRRMSGESARVYYTYRVVARLHDSREIELVRGIHEPEQARFIQRKLERHLNLSSDA